MENFERRASGILVPKSKVYVAGRYDCKLIRAGEVAS